MNPNKALWEKGDFTRIAESMRDSGEALVRTLGVPKGMDVLDLGCGDGTTALPEARIAGVSVNDRAMMPTSALPVCANCAACETFSPRTRRVCTRSYRPA